MGAENTAGDGCGRTTGSPAVVAAEAEVVAAASGPPTAIAFADLREQPPPASGPSATSRAKGPRSRRMTDAHYQRALVKHQVAFETTCEEGPPP